MFFLTTYTSYTSFIGFKSVTESIITINVESSVFCTLICILIVGSSILIVENPGNRTSLTVHSSLQELYNIKGD